MEGKGGVNHVAFTIAFGTEANLVVAFYPWRTSSVLVHKTPEKGPFGGPGSIVFVFPPVFWRLGC